MEERPLDKYKKICYNKRKRHFYRSGKREPIGLIFIKKYDIIIMEENNNKPIGFIQIERPYADSRSALRGLGFREKLRPYRGR